MSSRKRYDAIVVGAGPNGLSAAITIAREHHSVLLIEANDTIGGGARSAELTIPGFVHDICSGVHPFAASSPFFRSLSLEDHGLMWVQPKVPLAHPFDDGTAATLERSVRATAESLGRDGRVYRRVFEPLVADWEKIIAGFLGPPFRIPAHPLALVRFGAMALLPAGAFASLFFRGAHARALLAGLASHSIRPLTGLATTAAALLLGMLGHAVGWPLASGGSQRIANALASCLRSYGGEIVTGMPISSLDELPPARAVLMNVTPRQLLIIAGDRLPGAYRRRLQHYRYGPGVFKVDWALSAPIPWRASACRDAGTVHLGGELDEIAAAENAVWQSRHPERPTVLLAQPSLFDRARAPEGNHTAWAYCHVPNGSAVDMTTRIEAQVERFAPGFRDCILARHTMDTHDLEHKNANLVGGDIAGGVLDLPQFIARPALRAVPYETPTPGLFICSSSTPPGGAVHGMCGYFAGRAALTYLRRHDR